MEVASLPSDESSRGAPGHVTKRLLQGRPLPAILVDDHPGPRYPTFRPHQRRLSQQKGASNNRDGASTPCDSGVFSSPEGDPLPHVMGTNTKARIAKAKKAKKQRRTPVAPPATAIGAAPTATTTTSGTTAAAAASGTTGTGTGTGAAASTGTGQSTLGVTNGGGGAGGGAGLMSSTSSGVSSGLTCEQPHRKTAQKQTSRMGQYGRATTVEGTDYFVNPDPVPFMPSNFMSSTMLKKIPIPKRHQDTFGGYEYNFTGQRGVMLHTDRYQVRKQYEALKTLEGLNQRDRLLAEMAYLEDLRSIRRRREVVPHRVQLDLFLGGKKLDYEERFDIKREIQRLKAMAMPSRARDLFHGKGIHLPPNHLSILPKTSHGPEDSDSDEEVRISAPASMQRTVEHAFNLNLQSPTFERQISLTLGDVPHTRSFIHGKRHQLPSISKSQTPRTDHHGLWLHRSVTLSLSLQRRVAALHARPQQHRRDDATLTQVNVPPTSRSAAWVEEQNQLLSRPPRTTGSEEKVAKHPAQSSQPADPTFPHTEVPGPQVPSQTLQRTVPPGSGPASEVRAAEEEEASGVLPAPAARAVESGSSQGRGRQYHVLIKEDESHAGSLEGGRQASPPVSHTPNPLKVGLILDVSEEQESSLRQTFERLDTDMDGHLQYHQLKSQLPKEFSKQQEWFVKQVYEITKTSAAFFGVDEFLMMTQLTNTVASLTGQAQEAYGKIDFNTLEECIIKYVELFQQADSSQKGRISAETLRALLGKSQNKPAPDENSRVWNTILDSVSLDYASNVNRTEYLAHIPLFMALAPPTL